MDAKYCESKITVKLCSACGYPIGKDHAFSIMTMNKPGSPVYTAYTLCQKCFYKVEAALATANPVNQMANTESTTK